VSESAQKKRKITRAQIEKDHPSNKVSYFVIFLPGINVKKIRHVWVLIDFFAT
jgi:hypothetical protein